MNVRFGSGVRFGSLLGSLSITALALAVLLRSWVVIALHPLIHLSRSDDIRLSQFHPGRLGF